MQRYRFRSNVQAAARSSAKSIGWQLAAGTHATALFAAVATLSMSSACSSAAVRPAAAHRRGASPVQSLSRSSASPAVSNVREHASSSPRSPEASRSGVRLEPIGPNEHLDWRLTNDSDAEIRGLGGMGFVLRFQRLDYDGQWVDYVLISRPPMIALTPPRVPIARVVAPHASVVVSESPLGRVPFAAGTYRVSVTYGDARYSSVDRFASAQFEIVGITTAQAQDALAALDQPQPQSCLPHDVLPRFVLVAPPPMAERLLELHNVTFENWYALFETGIDHARSWALLRAGARSPDGEIALAAASAAMVRTPRCEFADMAWRPLIDALDHRRQLPPEVVEALGGLMGCGHDRTIERRLINRIATGNDDERAAISAWLISRRPEDPSISDVALEMQASNALRTAARRTGSSCFRSYFRRSAQWLAERHPTALEPSELDCLDNAPTGCAVDPRLRPLLDAPFGLDQRVELR